jgi:hypothetical protein
LIFSCAAHRLQFKRQNIINRYVDRLLKTSRYISNISGSDNRHMRIKLAQRYTEYIKQSRLTLDGRFGRWSKGSGGADEGGEDCGGLHGDDVSFRFSLCGAL